jgi:hypothetical protein
VSDWQDHCTGKIGLVDFYGFGFRLLFTIYVDDFKLAGPQENIAIDWDLLRQHIDIGPSSRSGMYLGCNIIKQNIRMNGNSYTNAIVYDAEPFLEQCVAKYLHVAGSGTVLKQAKTPFIQSSGMESVYRRPIESDSASCPWCSYCENATEEKQNTTHEHDQESELGKLASLAASVLMKCLYAARMCRFDLLRAVQGLAKFMTKWTKKQDRELHQLMSYIHHSKHMKMPSICFKSSYIRTRILPDVLKP